MPITRAALRRLRLPLPRSSGGGMFTQPLHATARRSNSTGPTQYTRDLPAKNIYLDSFPCTLHYYSWRGPTMAMHGSLKGEFLSSPITDLDPAEHDNLLQDVVRVQEDGLVYPGPEGNDSVWNGAMLMPHATFLLEFTASYDDFYEEQKAAGRNVPEPYFFTVPKGLRMPNTLFLAHEHSEVFSLMPRTGMSLSALNRELNNLFSSSACSKVPFREWFKKYTVTEAHTNSATGEWEYK